MRWHRSPRGPPTSLYLRDMHGPEGGLRDNTSHQQPHVPADAVDGGQPAQVSEAFPQEQHQEGPSAGRTGNEGKGVNTGVIQPTPVLEDAGQESHADKRAVHPPGWEQDKCPSNHNAEQRKHHTRGYRSWRVWGRGEAEGNKNTPGNSTERDTQKPHWADLGPA